MMNKVRTSDNKYIDLDHLPLTLTYNTDGTIDYLEVSSEGIYRQTFTYSSGKVVNISGWVKQ